MVDEQGDKILEARQSYFEKQRLVESARIAFQFLAAVLRNASLYPQQHPILQSSAEKL